MGTMQQKTVKGNFFIDGAGAYIMPGIMNTYSAISAYRNAKDDGQSTTGAVASAGIDFLYTEALGNAIQNYNSNTKYFNFAYPGQKVGGKVGSYVGRKLNNEIKDFIKVAELGTDSAISKYASSGKMIAGGKKLGSLAGGLINGMIPYILLGAAQSSVSAGIQIGKQTARSQGEAYRTHGQVGSGYFRMNQPAYTMRQRGLQAIQQTGMGLQSTFNNEARTYYRSNFWEI